MADYSNFDKIQSLQFVFLVLGDTFPNKHGYDSSVWADWECRIKEGHESEENSIAEKVKQWKLPIGSEDWPFDPGDWITDAYWQNCRLTNSMYASMVVSLWSDVEHFLKSLLKTYHKILIAQIDRWSFDKIIKGYQKGPYINLEKLESYSILNAIQILNNSFKHNDGYYKPCKGKHTQISQDLLNEWVILSDNNEIEYSKLPIKKLVLACNVFATDLLNKTKSKLKENN